MWNNKSTLQLPVFAVLILSLSATACRSGGYAVRAWEEEVALPTYLIGEPLTTPMFYHGRAYQGAQGHFYPYPVQDKLTYVRKDKVYKMLYLENRYVKIGVLPEIGGRVFYALDKTNNYKFFYSASAVKPGLVGMLGAWLDGGIEWNIPHHHRPSAYLPVQYKLENNPDGSKTIWVGEMEINHRMRWVVGLTLYPDRSYLEATFRLINQTPASNSFLYFANVGVHANSDYQVIFPPSTEIGTYHSKTEFVRWPIADGRFQGKDFSGQDVSWWKTHVDWISIFAHECTEDYFGGYDHGKKAGVIYIADHNISPGKKFWTWGSGEEGKMWDKLLTEEADGPVMELMAGSYSDNQPDYSWIQPYEVKTVRQYWYPFQQLGIVKNANLKAAVNLEVTPAHIARMGFQSTAEHRDARVTLVAGGKSLFEQAISIDPGRPFLKEAEKAASAALAVDPLDLWARRERAKTGKEEPHPFYFAPDTWNDDVQLYLEMAVAMASAGLWEEGASVLEELAGAYPDKSRINPMVYYWLGYLKEKAGRQQEASRSYELAGKMPSEYCFPFRVESIAVLNQAMEKNPKDARAPYYLGNLLYDRQPAEAIKVWEKARSLDDKFAMVHRNLADAYAWTEGDYRKGIESLEIAVSLQPHPKFLAELDELYEKAGAAPVIDYFIGSAYEGLGDAKFARASFEKSAAVPSAAFAASRSSRSYAPEILYYRGCSLRKLGRTAEAGQIFDGLIKSGQEALRSSGTSRPDYFAKFGERESRETQLAQGHYVLALGYLGNGRRQEAKAELEKAIKLNGNHLEAQYHFAALSE